jgi:hypothetical protein
MNLPENIRKMVYVISKHFPRQAEKKYSLSEDSRCPGWYSNTKPPECNSQGLQFEIHVFCSISGDVLYIQ